jgi:hypothetical protein
LAERIWRPFAGKRTSAGVGAVHLYLAGFCWHVPAGSGKLDTDRATLLEIKETGNHVGDAWSKKTGNF